MEHGQALWPTSGLAVCEIWRGGASVLARQIVDAIGADGNKLVPSIVQLATEMRHRSPQAGCHSHGIAVLLRVV